MNCPLELAKQLAYWLVIVGCVLALVTAIKPSRVTPQWIMPSLSCLAGPSVNVSVPSDMVTTSSIRRVSPEV